MKHIVYQGDALEVLKKLPEQSVNCVMTSPPYWALRVYSTNPVIWDGKDNCQHDFSLSVPPKRKRSKNDIKDKYSKEATKSAYDAKDTNFCIKCNAWSGELGLEPDFELYIKHLCDIFDQVKRVLRDDGTCWVNIGDTYSGSGKGAGFNGESKESWNFDKKPKEEHSIPSKSLIGIPFRFALEMINRGWILRNTLIWHKRNCMPSSAKDRFTVDFEYLFFFSKKKKYYFETQFEPLKESTKKRINYGWDGVVVENIGRNQPQKTEKMGKRWGNEETGRNKRTVWTINTKPFPEAHFAVFPPELVETPIKAGCPEFVCKKCEKPREKIINTTSLERYELSKKDVRYRPSRYEGKYGQGMRYAEREIKGYTDCKCNVEFKAGTILDPFIGSGTVSLVAEKLKRNSIGIELNPKYIEIAKKRMKKFVGQTKLDGDKTTLEVS